MKSMQENVLALVLLRVVWQFLYQRDIWQVRLLMWYTMQRKQGIM